MDDSHQENILKKTGLVEMGKRLRDRQDWQRLVSRWQTSGLSMKQFCKENGVSPSTFWRWKDRVSAHCNTNGLAVFLPVKVAATSGGYPCGDNQLSGSIEILVAGKYPVRVTGNFGGEVLDSVITVLERHTC